MFINPRRRQLGFISDARPRPPTEDIPDSPVVLKSNICPRPRSAREALRGRREMKLTESRKSGEW